MPFLEDGISFEAPGRIGSGLPKATLVVQPDQVLHLKRRLEDRRDKIELFMRNERDNLTVVPPPGADPCSREGVEALSQNGQSAMDALDGFVAELTNVIDALDEAARMYGLAEESSTEAFRQGPG